MMDIALLSYSEPEEIMDSNYGSESFSDGEERESYRSESAVQSQSNSYEGMHLLDQVISHHNRSIV